MQQKEEGQEWGGNGMQRWARTPKQQLTWLLLSAVAGHLVDSHREGADCSRHPGLALPHRQYLLAHLVDLQSLGKMAAPRPPLPDLLRDVRIHGRSVHRWVVGRLFSVGRGGPHAGELDKSLRISPSGRSM